MEFPCDFRQLSTLIHHVVLLRAEFERPKIVSAVGLAAPALRWALPHISSLVCFAYVLNKRTELENSVHTELNNTIIEYCFN